MLCRGNEIPGFNFSHAVTWSAGSIGSHKDKWPKLDTSRFSRHKRTANFILLENRKTYRTIVSRYSSISGHTFYHMPRIRVYINLSFCPLYKSCFLGKRTSCWLSNYLNNDVSLKYSVIWHYTSTNEANKSLLSFLSCTQLKRL